MKGSFYYSRMAWPAWLGAFVCASAALAGEPSSGPASGVSNEQREALETLIRSIEELQGTTGLADLLSERRRDAESDLERAGAEVETLSDHLAEIQARKLHIERQRAALIAAAALVDDRPREEGNPPPTRPAIADSDDGPPATRSVDQGPGLALFTQHVRPTFEAHCVDCHGGRWTKSGLDVTTRGRLLAGGDGGPAVVPGDAGASLLYKLVTHAEQPAMPHKADKLPDETVAHIAAWIDAGAPYASPLAAVAGGIAGTQEAGGGERTVTDADRAFWSFQPLADAQPPAVADEAWCRTPVDRFILAALEAKGPAPSSPADRRTLLRRAAFDLTGLPPTPDEIESFLKDESPEAYDGLVDRLLASPHYGERWGRHWLDLARYADSDGYEFDEDRPHAYPYRDFVIEALNRDLPYDVFVKWQLAGDEYEPDNPLAIAATGFCTAGPTISNQSNEKNRYDELDDILSTAGSAVLGLTVACARCHDHKYDPIPQRDYYRMLSAFTTSQRREVHLASRETAAEYARAKAEFEKRLAAPTERLERILQPFRKQRREAKIDALPITEREKALLRAPVDKTNRDQRELLDRYEERLEVVDEELRGHVPEDVRVTWDTIAGEIAQIEKTRPTAIETCLALTDTRAAPEPSFFLARGEPKNKTGEVDFGFLTVLTAGNVASADYLTARPADAATTWRRRALAEWLTDVDRGAGALTARVMVNRLWQHHFGEGLVRTPSDFGFQGDRPSHPELLDWLAGELIRNGWRLKPLHKLIMTSAVYMQGASHDEAKAGVDPENRLWWHRRAVRLEAEAIRDAMLAVSGCLNPERGGPGVHPWVHPDAIATGSTHKWPEGVKDGPETWRRSVYVFVKRSVVMPMFEAFDVTDATASCARRATTTTPPQALALLNNAFVRDQAGHFAERLRREAGVSPVAQIVRAYQLALARPPGQQELDASLDFLKQQAGRYEQDARRVATEDERERPDGAAVVRPVADVEPESERPIDRALVDLCQVILNLNEFLYVD